MLILEYKTIVDKWLGQKLGVYSCYFSAYNLLKLLKVETERWELKRRLAGIYVCVSEIVLE